jgi:hypothetical protein
MISAISKPAKIGALDMGTSLKLYAVLCFGAPINQTRSDHGPHSRRRPTTLQTHEMQRPKICARAGSATRLNTGSHPSGGCGLAPTAGNETVELRFSGNRSPLFVRFTETVCCAVLAAPGRHPQKGSHRPRLNATIPFTAAGCHPDPRSHPDCRAIGSG